MVGDFAPNSFAQFKPRRKGDVAVVLLSGGLDSATVLALVKNLGYSTYALSFRYGQRHSSELIAAEKIAQHNIIDDEAFVVKSVDKEIALAIVPKHVEDNFWKLVIITVFRESFSNPFRVGENQLVIWVN